MAPSTADRWFISDYAYRAINSDYAVTGCTTQEIKQQTLAHDFQPRYFSRFPSPRSFSRVHGLIRNHHHGYVFASMPYNTLIYADVDQSNPDHEKEIRAQVAAAHELEKATEQNEAVKATIIKKLLDSWNKAPVSQPDMPEPNVEQVEFTEEMVAKFLYAHLGTLPPPVFDAIAGLGDEERKEALMLMSGQLLIPVEAQRPVLVLVSIVDTAQSTTVGASQGYRTAYDPLSKELTTIPFTSDEQTHPLGDKWFADLPEDGISFRGTYQEFVTKFLEFMKDINEDRVQSSEKEGFKFLVWAATMDWLVGQWYCFFNESNKVFNNGDLGWEEAYEEFLKLQRRFSEVKFPNKERKIQEKYEKDDVLDIEFLDFKDTVEKLEGYMRDAAVEVKGEGKEKKAREAARMWDRIEEAMRDYEKVVEEK
ncbi:MAG: hypothetical protein LQ343_002079 [Gyalolechia ehrenbergii]|nr:MAG: hypothetical protein LQ343_002079 [Gyalolechia ehrenbergii]